MTITNYFSKILIKQREINYPFPDILLPPAKVSHIQQTEKKLNLTFNRELKELYSLANGTNEKGQWMGLIPNYCLMDLDYCVGFYNAHVFKNTSQLNNSFLNSRTNFKPGPKLFPFLNDGAGNCYWIDLNENTINYGEIFWTNNFGEEPDYLFDSLTILFKTIAECYDNSIITIDEEERLVCDYKKWGDIAKKNNIKHVAFWNIYTNM